MIEQRVSSGSPFEARYGFCRAALEQRWAVEMEAEALIRP